MRLILAAIGRMKAGPERQLVERYLDRIAKSGKSVGISRIDVVELPESRAEQSNQRKHDEETALLTKLPENCVIFAFDERGKSPDSREFAAKIQTALESGVQDLALVIGGPDGLSSGFRQRADRVISFGALTLPHQIARILVAEQSYRAITIITNHPYHRD